MKRRKLVRAQKAAWEEAQFAFRAQMAQIIGVVGLICGLYELRGQPLDARRPALWG